MIGALLYNFGFEKTIGKATAGFEPAIGVLQTPALPLGHVATTHKYNLLLASELGLTWIGYCSFTLLDKLLPSKLIVGSRQTKL